MRERGFHRCALQIAPNPLTRHTKELKRYPQHPATLLMQPLHLVTHTQP